MNYLLDTHALIWFLDGNPDLPESSRKAIKNLDNTVWVSVVAIWEIALKISIGKLELTQFPSSSEIFPQLTRNRISIEPIKPEVIPLIETLPFHHKDPFDRIMIAQAMFDDLTIITKDTQFQNYPVKVYW